MHASGVPGLSRDVICVVLCLTVLIQYRRVIDRQRDRHTDTRRRLTPAHSYSREVKTVLDRGPTDPGPCIRAVGNYEYSKKLEIDTISLTSGKNVTF